MRPIRPLGAAAVGVAAVSRTLVAQCEQQWLPAGWKLGFDGPIQATTVWDPDGPGPAPAELVVAGTFTIADDQPATGVAAWDGLRWRALGDGLGGTPTALTVHEGRLIVGGTFVTPGPAHALNIARLNGNAWEAMDNGITEGVTALGSLETGLLAAQSPTTFVPSAILRWTGTTWEQVGQEVAGPINTIFASETLPTVAGPTTGVMRLEGSTWVRLGTLSARTAIEWNGQLILGKADSLNARVAFRWDGAAWQPMYQGLIPPFQQCRIDAFGIYNGTLVAAGEVFATTGDGLPVWNGTSWVGIAGSSELYFPDAQQVSTLIQFRDELLAGGEFGRAGTGVANCLARWNGERWKSCVSPPLIGPQEDNYYDPPVAYAAVSYAGGLAIGGKFELDTELGPAINVAWWDGARWRPLGSGLPSSWTGQKVDALLEYQGQLIAGGRFSVSGFVQGAMRWDGTAWQSMGLPGTAQTLTTYHGELLAAADYGGSVQRWNGASWVPLGTPPNGAVHALSTYRGDLIAAGAFSSAGGASATCIARWDGAQWSPLGTGVPGGVEALTVFADRLVAASMTAGVPPARLSYWDGFSWHPWPVLSVFEGAFINGIAADDTSMYVAGSFATFAGLPANSIVRWDGIQWNVMGGGLKDNRDPAYPAYATSVLADAGRVVVTGSFTAAGGLPLALRRDLGPPDTSLLPQLRLLQRLTRPHRERLHLLPLPLRVGGRLRQLRRLRHRPRAERRRLHLLPEPLRDRMPLGADQPAGAQTCES